MRWRGCSVVFITGVLGLCGCETTLETGYKPRSLGATEAERKAFYASPFSPEAAAAAEERKERFDARKPTLPQ